MTLDVDLYGKRLGTLEASSAGALTFSYLSEALSDPGLPAISLSLPKREDPYGDSDARPWFEGLLPEGEFRNLIARTLRTDVRDVSGLLGAIGGECAGAVTLWAANQRRPTPEYRAIETADLQTLQRLRTGSQRARHVASARLSLAGALEKIALRWDGRTWYRGVGGAPTTDILKWPPEDYPDLAINEAYCVRLLTAAGVRTAASRLGEAGTNVLLVQRYDRLAQPNGDITVLHQEDICQALGIPPADKYQRGLNGPSLRAIAQILNAHARVPQRELLRLAAWVVGCYLLHNADGHGKNLSLLSAQTGLELAPTYDVVSTRPYPKLDQRFGLRLGRASLWTRATRDDWRRATDDLGIDYETLRELAGDLRALLLQEAPRVRQELVHDLGGEPPILGRIDQAVDHMSAKLGHGLLLD